MTFEEFFRKKRIDLAALNAGEPALFSEFNVHYEQMGEKSFDYSKKYWFNKLRHQFPLAPEVKTEKPHIANPIAEQTINESLTETLSPAPSPKVGFVPRFKAGTMPKPAAGSDDKKEEIAITPAESTLPEKIAGNSEPKPAYKPRFSMNKTSSKPPED